MICFYQSIYYNYTFEISEVGFSKCPHLFSDSRNKTDRLSNSPYILVISTSVLWNSASFSISCKEIDSIHSCENSLPLLLVLQIRRTNSNTRRMRMKETVQPSMIHARNPFSFLDSSLVPIHPIQ